MQDMDKKLGQAPGPVWMQAQIFTPVPCTRSTVMYSAGVDPFTDRPVWSEKTSRGRQKQKQVLERDYFCSRKKKGGRKKAVPGRKRRVS
jgi:hypothetical protein